MSQNQENIVIRLTEKIKILTSLFSLLKEQKETLIIENKQLIEKLEQQENYIKELEKNYKNLQLAKAVSDSSGESTEARRKIEEIVREIDICIGLLNK